MNALLASLLLSLFCVAAGQAAPNVVVILADDQGWGDLSVHGNRNLKTPHIDSLARDGALFERFYVCPVCSPTRAEFLTGRYHVRGGVYSTSTGGERLDLDERTIGEAFKAAGYATAAFGKWHNGMQWPYHPNARGFDEFYGFCSGHWGHYFSPELEHNGKLVRGKGYVNDDFTNHALQFIEKNKDRRFFCYLPFNTPHSPMQVPDRFYRKFDGANLKMRNRDPKRERLDHTRAALAMCESIDWNVGRILKKLDELKLAKNTIVVYFSDNGPNGWRWNGDMRGRKGSTDEGGVRVPMLVRWPGHIPPGQRVKRIAAAIDLLPTLTDMCGIQRVGTKPLDGVSMKYFLIPDMRVLAKPSRMIFSHWRGRVSARTDRYRLDNAGRLYDMTKDPGQRKDVSKAHPEIAAKMRKAVAKWKKDVLSELDPSKKRPFTVGYSETTPLPARDGVPHGNVKRSGRAPNCSFFTNWTSPDDRITWDVQVGNAGRYEATLYYTCPKDSVGSTIELSLGGNRVRTKVATAWDPPLYGKAQDRSPRAGESYVKDFKPLRLGVIELPKGRGELTLRAVKIAGKQAADVRYVFLKRVK
jgi:arylsulfatase A-like enzyme